MWLLHGPVVQYRDAAEKMLRSDANVRAALMAAQQRVSAAYAAARSGSPPPAARTQWDALKGILGGFGIGMADNPPTPSPQQH